MHKSLLLFAFAVLTVSRAAALEAAGYRAIVEEVVVDASAQAAWAVWTSNEGFQSFFPGRDDLETNIELRPGGPFEVFMLQDNPPGERGCDDCQILGYQEGRMLSFTWTNRPDMAVRPHHTHVVVTFEPIGEKSTRVVLVADGWGDGPDWDAAYAYFDEAWSSVMQAFKAHFDEGD